MRENRERANLLPDRMRSKAPAGYMMSGCQTAWRRGAPQCIRTKSDVRADVVLVVKNPSASAGDLGDMGSIPGLGRSLEKEMATCSSIPRKIPWTEEPSGMQSLESQRVRHDRAHTHTDKGSSQGSGNSHI